MAPHLEVARSGILVVSWFVSLLSKDDSAVCSVTVCGLASIIALIGLTIWHPDWNPTGFSMSAVAIIGAIAGGKRIRDGVQQ